MCRPTNHSQPWSPAAGVPSLQPAVSGSAAGLAALRTELHEPPALMHKPLSQQQQRSLKQQLQSHLAEMQKLVK